MKWKRPKPASSNPFSSAPSSSKPSRPWAANCGRASRAATRSPTSPPSSASASARSQAATPPATTRGRARQITGRDRRNTDPVLRRYERICFEKQHVRIIDPDHVRVGTPMASLLHPGHPLMQSVTEIVLEQHRNKVKQGAVLVDPSDSGLAPKVMFIIEHRVLEGADPARVASRRMQFVEIDASGQTIDAGWAPHLDLKPLAAGDMALIQDVLAAPWIAKDLEHAALAHAGSHLVPEHFDEVRSRREKSVDKTLNAVHERLVKEINFWSDRYIKLRDDLAAGKDVRLTLENV